VSPSSGSSSPREYFTLKTKALPFPETSVNVYHFTQGKIPHDFSLHYHLWKDVQSCTVNIYLIKDVLYIQLYRALTIVYGLMK
jgi:hypothetical protein